MKYQNWKMTNDVLLIGCRCFLIKEMMQTRHTEKCKNDNRRLKDLGAKWMGIHVGIVWEQEENLLNYCCIPKFKFEEPIKWDTFVH